MILVISATGKTGSACVKHLLAQGASVRALVQFVKEHRALYA